MSEDEADVPNQHAVGGRHNEPPVKTIEVVESKFRELIVELYLLREQVTALQARGTEQLMSARRCALEAAAKECDWFKEHDIAVQCARNIRQLAKR